MNLTIRHKSGTKVRIDSVSAEAGRRIELLYADLQRVCTENPPENQRHSFPNRLIRHGVWHINGTVRKA